MIALAERLSIMTKHGAIAEELFREGYNCAQAVFIAFCDKTGFDKDLAAKTASSFGGGLGRMREVCGAVSGAAMVLGVLKGYADPADHDAKKAHYALVQEFARRFKEYNGSIICRELLSGVPGAVHGGPHWMQEPVMKIMVDFFDKYLKK